MRVLHYFHHFHLSEGGVCRAVLDFALWQSRAGADVVIASYDPRDVPADWKADTPGLPRVVTLAGPGRIRAIARPGAFARAFGPVLDHADVVHTHDIWDPTLAAISRLARIKRTPYIVSPHGMLADYCVGQKALKKTLYTRFFGRPVLDGAAFICLTAQGELDQSAKRHPKTPGVVLPLVFDTDPYREAPTPDAARAGLPLPPPNEPAILYLSRLDYKKRPDLLLAAGRVLRDRGIRFRLIFAGPSDPAYDARLRAYARTLRMEDITTFLGMVPAALKPSLFACADLFALPTSMENFGFVYFESLVSGTPVLTTKGTDTWPELQASGAARIVDLIHSDVPRDQVGGGDVAAFAEAMADLISDRARLRSMGNAGRAWVLSHLEPLSVARRYLDLYARAAAKARAGATP